MNTAATEARGPLAGRVALVTGASRGLGRAAATRLGALGAQIIGVARTVGALEELDDAIRTAGGPPATLTPLDLKDGDGIDRLGGAIYQRWGRLDLLVHAAAHGGMLGPAASIRPAEARALAEVNYLATLRLIRSVDPLFAGAEAPAAAFVVHRVAGRANWGGYGASKAAAEAAAASYAAESTQARVVLFEPAPMATALRSKMYPGEDRALLATPEAEAERLAAALLDGVA